MDCEGHTNEFNPIEERKAVHSAITILLLIVASVTNKAFTSLIIANHGSNNSVRLAGMAKARVIDVISMATIWQFRKRCWRVFRPCWSSHVAADAPAVCKRHQGGNHRRQVFQINSLQFGQRKLNRDTKRRIFKKYMLKQSQAVSKRIELPVRVWMRYAPSNKIINLRWKRKKQIQLL
jgi:hypothetical protein